MAQPVRSAGAVRLIFEYEADVIRLVGQRRVDVAVTGFDVPAAVRSGHFVEVRGAEGQRLNRVAIRGAFQDSVEVFPEDHRDAIVRVPVAAPSGAFTVVVPAPATAASVAVLRVTAPPAADPTDRTAVSPPADTVELASFRLEGSGAT